MQFRNSQCEFMISHHFILWILCETFAVSSFYLKPSIETIFRKCVRIETVYILINWLINWVLLSHVEQNCGNNTLKLKSPTCFARQQAVGMQSQSQPQPAAVTGFVQQTMAYKPPGLATIAPPQIAPQIAPQITPSTLHAPPLMGQGTHPGQTGKWE